MREQLKRSLEHPHPETVVFDDWGLAEWARSLPEEDTESLVDNSIGKDVKWVPGEGWVEELAPRPHPPRHL